MPGVLGRRFAEPLPHLLPGALGLAEPPRCLDHAGRCRIEAVVRLALRDERVPRSAVELVLRDHSGRRSSAAGAAPDLGSPAR